MLTVIKVLNARLTAPFTLEIDFSDQSQGVFDAHAYLANRAGLLLDKLRDPEYFSRFFIDECALYWPNGLEISLAKIHELSAMHLAAGADTWIPKTHQPQPKAYVTNLSQNSLGQ
jgi:hypothetical protein